MNAKTVRFKRLHDTRGQGWRCHIGDVAVWLFRTDESSPTQLKNARNDYKIWKWYGECERWSCHKHKVVYAYGHGNTRLEAAKDAAENLAFHLEN